MKRRHHSDNTDEASARAEPECIVMHFQCPIWLRSEFHALVASRERSVSAELRLAVNRRRTLAQERRAAAHMCGFRRMRTVIPIDCGQRFRSIADSVPVIADSGSRRRLQGLTRRCRCQAFHANPPVDTSSGPILLFDRHHPSAPTCTRLVPARAVAVKDGPSSGHRVSGAQRP
jgi:hypothetical protein